MPNIPFTMYTMDDYANADDLKLIKVDILKEIISSFNMSFIDNPYTFVKSTLIDISEFLQLEFITVKIENNLENGAIILRIKTNEDEYSIIKANTESYYIMRKDGRCETWFSDIEIHPIFLKLEDKYGKSIEELTHGMFSY